MRASRVLVVGEALIDIVDGEEILGGSPANVALGLGRLGVGVDLLTAIGADDRGDRIIDHLGRSGVTVLPESRSLERTSTARATIGPDGSATYDFDIEWRVPVTAADEHDIVHVGSIACFLEPGADAVVTLARRAAARGATVTFDPNIRPDLLGGTDALHRVEELAKIASVVKLSDEDAAHLYPGLSVDAVVDRLLTLEPRIVAVTEGGAGAVIASADGRVRVAAPKVTVVDTVGAGDTFMASLVASLPALPDGLLRAAELEPVLRRCVAAAAVTVSRAGADLPWRDEVVG
jgi:fructokinase